MTPPKIPQSVQVQRVSHLILFSLILIAAVILIRHEYMRRTTPLDMLSPLPNPTRLAAETPTTPTPQLFAADPGFKPLGPPEFFDEERLADKINGKAELYLSAGFVQLTTQRFQLDADPDLWFELFQYEMGSADNAFAVFSAQRREGAPALDYLPHGYDTANAIFFILDTTYYEMIGSRAAPALMAAMSQGLRTGVQSDTYARPAESAQVKGLGAIRAPGPSPADLFPEEGQVANSLTLLAGDAFGFERLDNVYTVQYQVADGELTAFISLRGHGDEADELTAAYTDFLLDYGGQAVSADEFPGGNLPEACRAMEVLDFIEVICTRNAYLFGLHEVMGREASGDLIRKLDSHLEGVAHGQ